MREDELLDQRLGEWIRCNEMFSPLNSGELASRVRELRSARTHRRRTIVVSTVLLFAGTSFYFAVQRFGSTPGTKSSQTLVERESQQGTNVAELDREWIERLELLHTEIEQVQRKAELLVVNLRIQQAISKADSSLWECDRRMLRDEQASQWLAATFRAMTTEDNP